MICEDMHLLNWFYYLTHTEEEIWAEEEKALQELRAFIELMQASSMLSKPLNSAARQLTLWVTAVSDSTAMLSGCTRKYTRKPPSDVSTPFSAIFFAPISSLVAVEGFRQHRTRLHQFAGKFRGQ